MNEAPIDTINKYMVASGGDAIFIMHPPTRATPLSKADALNLAAWLVALADRNGEFEAYRKAVEST